MKFCKTILLGTILASCVPAALATQIGGELFVTGTGTILGPAHSVDATSITFSNYGTTTGGNTRPRGLVVGDGSGGFSDFADGDSFFYDFLKPTPAGSTTGSGTFAFESATAEDPIELLQMTEDGVQLKVFITNVDDGAMVGTANSGSVSHHNFVPGTSGTFFGEGYVTLSNDFVSGNSGPLDESPIDFQLSNSGVGTGLKPFSVDIIALAPEPSSLVLLGSGIASAAGMMFRRRRIL
jgi:PEP-CTERM motif